jgi:HK97 family phage prohead protease
MSSCKIGSKCFLERESVNQEAKSVEVILSDETEIVRYSFDNREYYLTLSHSGDAVDLERAEILSLFINHDTNELPIGRFDNVRLEDGKLKATALFDEDDAESMKIFTKLSKGFLNSFSVGVSIHEKILTKEEDGVKYYKATKWSIHEASVVGIPAIPNAKVGLNLEATPTAKSDKSKTNLGANMQFDKENLDAMEAHFNALVLNKDTMERRAETSKLQLENLQASLDEANAEKEALLAQVDGFQAKQDEALSELKAETLSRVDEAVKYGSDAETVLAMLKADDRESASKIALEAQESDGGSTSEEPNGEDKSEDEELNATASALGITLRFN